MFTAATTLTFDKSQYALITLPEESYTESEDISLRFRTIHTAGLLLMTRSSLSTDAIELFLERGACKLTISLGPRSKVSVLTSVFFLHLSDMQYSVLHLQFQKY